MDWIIPLITACAGFGSAFIGGCFLLYSQKIAQRDESIRHARELAFRTAVEEWKVSQNNVDTANPVFPLQVFIVEHSIFVPTATEGQRGGGERRHRLYAHPLARSGAHRQGCRKENGFTG